MQWLRRWFMRHWFVGVYAIIGGFWLVTTVAWLVGAERITVGTRYGPPATIDFMRRHDRPALSLSDDVALSLYAKAATLSGSLIRVKPGPPVLCWLCGFSVDDGGIAPNVAYRNGDWFFRAPVDNRRSKEAHEGRQESREFILTIAYNRATHDRVMVSADATLEEQSAELASRGLEATEAQQLTPATVGDLPTLSMTSEGCMIYNLAFIAAALLWLLVGGLPALWVARRRARRAAV